MAFPFLMFLIFKSYASLYQRHCLLFKRYLRGLLNSHHFVWKVRNNVYDIDYASDVVALFVSWQGMVLKRRFPACDLVCKSQVLVFNIIHWLHRTRRPPVRFLSRTETDREKSLEEILIKIATRFRLQQDFLADLNDVLNLPGYTKLRRFRVKILLLNGVVEDYDREESRQELKDAAQAQCSQLYNRPSLDFSCLVAVKGVYDDDLFYYFPWQVVRSSFTWFILEDDYFPQRINMRSPSW